MKQISLFIPLLGTLLLSGCAGTSTEFECNATTSDTCMTMEQANEKAKKLGGLRSRHPGKRPPGCKAQRRFAHALFVVAAGPCSLPAGCHTPV